MQKIIPFLTLIALILLEYYLRLVVPNFPIVLVPEFIIFFAIFSLKGRFGVGLVLVAVFLYDFWGNSIPGVGVLVFLSLLAMLYLLSNVIDFGDNVFISAFTALVGSVAYVSVIHPLGGLFAYNLPRELMRVSWLGWNMIGFVFLEVAVILMAFLILRAVYIRGNRNRDRKLKRRIN